MSHEDRMISKIDRGQGTNPLERVAKMDLAYKKAREEVLSNEDYVLQEKDFVPTYGDAMVAKDIALADRLENEFDGRNSPEEKRLKQISDVFEAEVLMQSELSNWFGEEARTMKTSRYDDYKNKVDMVIEWFNRTEGSRILALAVDVTFSMKGIENKLASVKAEIEGGKLGSIKYFKDERGDFMGTRNNVPRVVIGVSEAIVEEIADLWIRGKNGELSEHPIQYLFVIEIQTQLEAMRDYALALGKDGVVTAYEQALAAIQPLYESKQHYKTPDITTDGVGKQILLMARAKFKQK